MPRDHIAARYPQDSSGVCLSGETLVAISYQRHTQDLNGLHGHDGERVTTTLDLNTCIVTPKRMTSLTISLSL